MQVFNKCVGYILQVVHLPAIGALSIVVIVVFIMAAFILSVVIKGKQKPFTPSHYVSQLKL